jgi:hypothetical protein
MNHQINTMLIISNGVQQMKIKLKIIIKNGKMKIYTFKGYV